MQISPRYKRSFIEPPALSRRADEENRDDGSRVVFHRVSRDRQSIITVATLSLPRRHGAFEIIIDRSRAARGTGEQPIGVIYFFPRALLSGISIAEMFTTRHELCRLGGNLNSRSCHTRRGSALVESPSSSSSFSAAAAASFFLSFFSFFLFLLIYLFFFYQEIRWEI